MDAWTALGVDTLHVTPTDDVIEHDTSGDHDCACGPRSDLVQTDYGDRWLIVHHALDDRERIEREERRWVDTMPVLAGVLRSGPARCCLHGDTGKVVGQTEWGSLYLCGDHYTLVRDVL